MKKFRITSPQNDTELFLPLRKTLLGVSFQEENMKKMTKGAKPIDSNAPFLNENFVYCPSSQSLRG
jgi:hypothetical protein